MPVSNNHRWFNIFCHYKFNLNFADLRADQFDAKLEKIWFWQGKDVKGRRICISQSCLPYGLHCHLKSTIYPIFIDL